MIEMMQASQQNIKAFSRLNINKYSRILSFAYFEPQYSQDLEQKKIIKIIDLGVNHLTIKTTLDQGS